MGKAHESQFIYYSLLKIIYTQFNKRSRRALPKSPVWNWHHIQQHIQQQIQKHIQKCSR